MIAETLADYCSSAVGLVKDREEVIGVIVICLFFICVYIYVVDLLRRMLNIRHS